MNHKNVIDCKDIPIVEIIDITLLKIRYNFLKLLGIRSVTWVSPDNIILK
jgi:hypothetical protein